MVNLPDCRFIYTPSKSEVLVFVVLSFVPVEGGTLRNQNMILDLDELAIHRQGWLRNFCDLCKKITENETILSDFFPCTVGLPVVHIVSLCWVFL